METDICSAKEQAHIEKILIQNVMLHEMVIAVLQSTVRTGWGMCGVKKAESVADHMYRMAVLAFLANSKTRLNKDRYVGA